ncbi:MAG: thioredoxin domain-containing protein [Candidatus Nomurabacteria bacterium]
MKKYISILLLVIFIVPSIAFASWWNPASWGIFGFLHKKESKQTQVLDSKNYEEKINELQKQIEELKSKNTSQNLSSSSSTVSISDEVKAQVAKELKIQAAANSLNNKNKTLSEKVGVSKESLTACIKATDTNALNTKISTSVEAAMKALPSDQRGTPYIIVIGSNGVKSEIRGALPIDQVKKVIEEVKSGKVTSEYKGDVAVSETGDHVLGSSNATVKIIEYSDLECPYCKMFNSTMKQVVVDSNGSVSWTYRHWPIHQNSFEKLVAAECVAKLKGNDAFWKYVDLIFGMLNTGAPSVTDQL